MQGMFVDERSDLALPSEIPTLGRDEEGVFEGVLVGVLEGVLSDVRGCVRGCKRGCSRRIT